MESTQTRAPVHEPVVFPGETPRDRSPGPGRLPRRPDEPALFDGLEGPVLEIAARLADYTLAMQPLVETATGEES